MTVRTWLVLNVMGIAAGCGGGSDGGKGSSAAEMQRAVAVALTSGIDIEGGLIRRGEIPEADADGVTLSQDEAPLDLQPGDPPLLMTLGFDNPDESSDPVEATLIQFSESGDHIEVPRMMSEMGTDLTVEMTLDDAICDAFCDQVFTITMIQALKLASGKISEHLERLLRLDCTERGNHDLCEGGSGEMVDAGGGGGSEPTGMTGSGGSGGGTRAIDMVLGSAIVNFSLQHCMCMPDMAGMTAQPFCMASPVTAAERNCLVALAAANAGDSAVRTSLQCLSTNLMECTAPACDPTACDPAILTSFESECGMLPAGVSTEFQACLGGASP